MSNRIFGTLIGILLIIGGIFYFFKDIITISYGAVCVMIIGIALFANYFKRKNGLYLVFGTYMMLFGLGKLAFAHLPMYGYLMSAVFFLSPGIIFLTLYAYEKHSMLLTFGLLLTAIGVSIVLTGFFDFGHINMFFLCIAIGFVLNYLLNGKTKVHLIMGVIFLLLAFRRLLNLSGYTDVLVSFILVAFGFAIVVKSLIVKEEKNE